jgi:hypothetical protein
MKSLFSPADSQNIIDRLGQINENSPALWGKMNATQMLMHCQQPMQVSLGELRLKRGLMGFWFGKTTMKRLLSSRPFPKNLPTDPNFIITMDGDFTTEKSKLEALITQFQKADPEGMSKHEHPFFGKMQPEEWDRLNWRHLDHHLKQFGA